MFAMVNRRPLRFGSAWLLVLVAAALLDAWVVPGAQAEPIKAQIRAAKRDLIKFEEHLESLVEKFHRLQDESEALTQSVRGTRSALSDLAEPQSLYEHAVVTLLVKPVLEERLEITEKRREIVDALIPNLRRQIWEQGLERKEKIETLDAAIQLLQSARSGDLITKAGVGGGQLITYSADWAAVSQCESSGRWHIDDYFDGGLQFLPSTWWGFGGGEYAHYAYQATRRQQIDIAERVLAVQGPKAWPNCFQALPADTDE